MDTLEKMIEQMEQYITRNHLRKTPERKIVLEEVYNRTKPFDADTIYKELAKKRTHISRATVFSNIDLLFRCGILVRLPQTGRSVYILWSLCRKNCIVICRECGKVNLYRQTKIISLLQSVRPPRSKDMQTLMMSYVVCSVCSREKKRVTQTNESKYIREKSVVRSKE